MVFLMTSSVRRRAGAMALPMAEMLLPELHWMQAQTRLVLRQVAAEELALQDEKPFARADSERLGHLLVNPPLGLAAAEAQ